MNVDRKTLSITKACELVGVSRRTIYNWISGGKVEYVRTAGGSVRIFADTLWRGPHGEAQLGRKRRTRTDGDPHRVPRFQRWTGRVPRWTSRPNSALSSIG